jgi:hypothetical protein
MALTPFLPHELPRALVFGDGWYSLDAFGECALSMVLDRNISLARRLLPEKIFRILPASVELFFRSTSINTCSMLPLYRYKDKHVPALHKG